jgi:asparagine synthase (glutamine-hydrolysing)
LPTRSSGLYALVRLDGAPVDQGDAAALGLGPGEPSSCRVSGRDARSPGSVHEAKDAGGHTLLVGEIEEAGELAARLNLPVSVSPALLARAALERFGSDMASIVTGEWSLLHFERRGQLFLAMSAAKRDRIFYAVSGPLVAVASDLFCLAAMPWVGSSLDETGLLFALGRGELRGAIGERTMLSKARQVEPASQVTLTASGVHTARAEIFTPQPRWPGSFDDAMAQTEALMRTIVRTRLERAGAAAVMLSGGLDSSTLAFLAAQEREPGQPLLLLTSVAPPGSFLRDEAPYADLVAAGLGLEAQHLWPPGDANIYRPPEFVLSGSSAPPLPTRHCLAEAFQAAGRKLGAEILIDGTWGELTLTGYGRPNGLALLRRVAARLRRRLATGRPAGAGFHVRLSKSRMACLPEAVRTNLALPPRQPRRPGDGRWGYEQGAAKAMLHPNEFYPGAIRVQYPFRDLRLLRLFASFPSSFISEGGVGRAPARRIARSHLPDEVRLRTSGCPASPDHYERLRRQAPGARARIAAFRRADVDEWIDLDWLDSALERVARNGPRDVGDANAVQLTAITAEFLTWWRGRR